jgi:hypothetical protein
LIFVMRFDVYYHFYLSVTEAFGRSQTPGRLSRGVVRKRSTVHGSRYRAEKSEWLFALCPVPFAVYQGSAALERALPDSGCLSA